MKCFPVSRNVVVFALALLLAAASAPAALALPSGPTGGGGPAWGVEAFFGWVQGFFGGLFGGVGEEDAGPGFVTSKVRSEVDPNGNDLTAASNADSTEQSPTLQKGTVGR